MRYKTYHSSTSNSIENLLRLQIRVAINRIILHPTVLPIIFQSDGLKHLTLYLPQTHRFPSNLIPESLHTLGIVPIIVSFAGGHVILPSVQASHLIAYNEKSGLPWFIV